MIIIFKDNATQQQIDGISREFEEKGFKIHKSEGEHTRLIGLIGDTSTVDIDVVAASEAVADVKRVSEPYKKANRKFHPENTVIDVCGHKIGGGFFSVMAGPCSVESTEQITMVANAVKMSGAGFLRGGAFKPRTSPYSFQGMRAEGLELLREARKVSGLPIVTEIMNTEHIPLFEDVDMIQVGARNMQNFELLKELGRLDKPILLKRGLSRSFEDLLMCAEYIMAGGNEKVILCERGIRTFETSMRNTLDLSAIPMLKRKSHLPVVIDPSHAAGISWMVEPLALAAIAAGADGLMIEVHNDPTHAKSDGAQSLTPEQFDAAMNKIKSTVKFFDKELN
ncbi:MAG: 3-deoxy-7-phosphoheptulonate synthase [Oscillospiraceae bacterium]